MSKVKNEKQQCQVRITRSGGGYSVYRTQCQNRAVASHDREEQTSEKVEAYNEETFEFSTKRNQTGTKTVTEWFCATHDPERIAQYKEKKQREREAEATSKAATRNKATGLIERLGCGSVDWSTGRIVLWQSDLQKLLAELGR